MIRIEPLKCYRNTRRGPVEATTALDQVMEGKHRLGLTMRCAGSTVLLYDAVPEATTAAIVSAMKERDKELFGADVEVRDIKVTKKLENTDDSKPASVPNG